MTKLNAVAADYITSLKQFRKVLKLEKNDLTRDSAIKRFELTFDLCWKFLKEYLLEFKGIRCTAPKECIKESFKQGVIEYDDYWIDIVDIRNKTVHTYNESLADDIYNQLNHIAELFTHLEEFIKREIDLNG